MPPLAARLLAAAALVAGGARAVTDTVFDAGTSVVSPSELADAVGVRSAVLSDLNGDGFPDLASCSRDTGECFYNLNRLAAAEADWAPPVKFTSGEIAAGGYGATYTGAADVDRDGHPDLLVAGLDVNKLLWYRNRLHETGDFGPGLDVAAVEQPFAFDVADVDGDGDDDIVYCGFSGTAGKLVLLQHRDDGSWLEIVIASHNRCTMPKIGPVTADGARDVVVATNNGGVFLYENQMAQTEAAQVGAEPFKAAVTVSTAANAENTQSVALGDIDGDGNLDVITTSRNDKKTAWYRNTGAAPFFNSADERVIYTNSNPAVSTTTGDFDGDGTVDVVTASFGDDKVAWFPNTGGDGTFPSPEQEMRSVSGGVYFVVAGDVDGDGDVDLVTVAPASPGVFYYASGLAALCAAGVTPPEQPELKGGEISAEGELVLRFESDSESYVSLGWAMATGLGGCDDAAGAGANGWAHNEAVCPDEHTLTKPLPDALRTCGFDGPEDGGDVTYYETTVEATAVQSAGDVFGTPTTRTSTTAFRVRVEFPKDAQLASGVEAFNSVIELGLLSSQRADPTNKLFTWEFATSVQHPYYLEAPASAVASPSGDFDDVPPAVAGTDACSGETGACTQTFTVTATAGAAVCSLDGTATLTFPVRCRDTFNGACDLPSPATAELSFSYKTDSFCARVAEVAQVTPTLTLSTGHGGAAASDYVLQTTLHGRVALAIEGGLAVTAVRVVSLVLQSAAAVTAVAGGDFDASASSYALQVDGGDGGDGNEEGDAWVDFSFLLNDASVKFEAGAGQSTLTVTAVVEVTYANAGSQRFGVSTEAVSGPGSVSTTARASVGVASSPAAGGPTSTAGSTVLGVSTGTAMVAGVGLVAVVALAAGAAVAVRKRRQSGARRLKQASSSVELNDTAAVQV